jgi:hypothetical protein
VVKSHDLVAANTALAHAASGTLPNTTSDTASQLSMMGRRRRRSTHAPAGRLTSSQGSQEAALSTPTWNGGIHRDRSA